LRYCRPLQIPVAYTNHTRYDLYAQAYLPMMPDEVSQGLLQAYMPTFCRAVDLVITPSAGMEKILRELNVDVPIKVVPNGVDLKNFHSASPLPRTDFGYKEDDILLVYAGRIALEKNLPFLLESFTGIAQAIPNVHLLIIGGGVQQYEDEMRSLVSELKLVQRVRLTGRISYDQLPAYLAMCNIFVTASVTEVHPLSVIEGMGAGLPIMGIESVGVGDIVEDGVTGLLATHDLPAFTAKLTRLCLDPNLRAQMSNTARKASSAFAIENITRIMLTQYEKLVTESRPRKSTWRTRLRGFVEQFNS
ncbi:MAG: glycosyltransferase, partial [Anaerolineales bacterium]|nr:glycosyltransferase [Anaerolineales bacterium]